MMQGSLLLGAPGVYRASEEPVRALTGVRMDVAAFVGVAPRGPARLPAYTAAWADPPCGPAAPLAPLRSVTVPVESWSAYRKLYGSFEGPGLLPYAVAAFFDQGGRRAYIVRVVHDYGAGDPRNDQGTATGVVPGVLPRSGGQLLLRARDEGSWGNRLRATLAFRTHPLAFDAGAGTLSELQVDRDVNLAEGALLRLWPASGAPVLRFVTLVREQWSPGQPQRVLRATLDTALAVAPVRAELVEGELSVDDLSPDGIARGELHERLGFSAQHPRWLAAVLYRDSALVYPDPAWIDDDLLLPDATLRPPPDPPPAQFTCGRDRYPGIQPDDFFDPDWVPGDDQPRSGLHALVEVEDVAIVVAPDLYSPAPLVPSEDVTDTGPLAGPTFQACVEPEPPAVPPYSDAICPDGLPSWFDGSAGELEGLRLEPNVSRDAIVALQQRVIDLAEQLRSWVALLDVPPGSSQREALAWRARFGTPWAAGYHPWLRVARPDDSRQALISVPPSAFAAGIMAIQEVSFGVQHGPANLLALGAVSLLDRLSPARQGELHQASLNVYVAERDGIRLTAGRTLSRDPIWRQLSVRRLVTMIERALLRQMQWTVFEPNDARLRDELRRMLETYLGQLFRADAFRGKSPAEAFFVRCDDELNPPAVLDAGQLICHVGLAPAEPMEFIVVRLSREGDGTLLVED